MVTRTSFFFLLSEMIEVKLFFALVWLIQSAAVALWRWSTINIGLLWVMRGCFHIKFRLFPLQFIQRYAFWTVNVKTSKSWSWNFIPSAFPLQNISYANSLRPNTKQKWCMHIFVKFHRYSVANSIYYYRNTEASALLLLWLIQCSQPTLWCPGEKFTDNIEANFDCNIFPQQKTMAIQKSMGIC